MYSKARSQNHYVLYKIKHTKHTYRGTHIHTHTKTT
jgi:hypothetical protein